MNTPSLNVCLAGTEEPLATPQVLHAGPLSAELEAGNLRHIRYHGLEIIRAVSFIVRDRDWGTYAPVVHDLLVDEAAERFDIRYTAQLAEGQLSYRAQIIGTPTGLTFEAQARAHTDFATNRTGFVILHPLAGVVGQAATVEHADGTLEHTCFPELISPLQPMLNMRAISHEPVPGLRVTCRMQGDVFEMEDQRNWTDASYKTYVRPLALPWPYLLSPAEPLVQSVSLTVEDTRPAGAPARTDAVALAVGAPSGVRLPPLGVGLSQAELADTQAQLERLRPLRPQHVVYHFDARTSTADDLAQASAIARELGAEFWLEAVVVAVEGFEAELATLGQMHARLGSPCTVVLVSPAADLKATLPGSPWPPAPPLAELYRAARRAFPDVRLGGGMFSYFTELNRKRPPLEDIDLVTFTTTAILHAGDDATVMENLASLPSLTASVRAMAGHGQAEKSGQTGQGGKPFVVGPSAIGMRMNPYGEAPLRNLANSRQAMNENDPRQRGLLGAAWAVSYVAQMARGGAHAVTLGGTTGAQGVLAVPQAWPQPYFDEAGGFYPIFHIERLLAQRAGSALLDLGSLPPEIDALAFVDDEGGVTVLLANLTAQPREVALPAPLTGVRVLDATHFVAASQQADFFDTLAPAAGQRMRLAAYAVARLAWAGPAARPG